MVQLLDHLGRPVEKRRLLQEEAGPSLAGVRPVLSDHPSRGLTPQRLTAILVEAEEGDATRFLELAEDMEEKDLNYLAQMGTRKRAIAQLELTVEAAGDGAQEQEDAELVREYLRRDDLEEVLFDILDAIGKGFSVCELIWEFSATRWWPRDIIWRDPRWFAFDRENGTTLMLREGAQLLEMAPYKYIVHVHRAKSGLPIRGGLARAISWIWLFKNFTVKDWVAFGEVYGQPYRVGKYHPSASEGEKSKLLQAVASIGSDAAAIIPEGMLIEFIEAARGGSLDLYGSMAAYFDNQITKAILGQTLTSDVAGSGSRALGEVHDRVRNDIKRSDAKQLASTLNRDLVVPLVKLNRGERESYPRIKIGLPNELTTTELVEALSTLIPFDLQVEKSVIRDRLGLPDPPPDADILRAGPAPKAPPTPAAAAALGRVSRHAADSRQDDAIDELIRQAIGGDGWEPVMTPIAEDLDRLLAGVSSLERFRELLPELLESDWDDLVDRLARNLFAVRLAGEIEAPISDVEG